MSEDSEANHPLPVGPVLSYATPNRGVPAWVSHRFWPAIALPAALIYFGFTAYFAVAAAYAVPRDQDEPGVLFMCLACTAPLGIVALVAGLLGRHNLERRDRAARAIRIALIVPGFAALLHIVACAIGRDSFARTLPLAAAVILINVLVVMFPPLLMRDR